MASVDLHDLRMQEFPHSVRLALNKLELCLQSSQAPQMVVLQQRIIDEFIFCPHDANKHKSNPTKVLSFSINELIVVRLLCEHLAGVASSPSRNALLLVLFHPSTVDTGSQPHNPYNKNIPTSNPYARPQMMGGNTVSNPYTRNIGNPYGNFMAPYNNQAPFSSGNPYGGGSLSIPGGGQYAGGGAGGKNGSSSDSKLTHRLNVLAALVSLAIVTRNAKVLESVAVWMQQVCCLSSWSGQVCKRLIAEYCSDYQHSSSDSNHPLHTLPSLTPLFTCNLITCWAQIYARLGVMHIPPSVPSADNYGAGVCRRPPLPLLRLIVSWLRNSPPSLLLTPLTVAGQTATGGAGGSLAPGAAVTPLAPLLRWCVEAPFFLHSATARAMLKSENKQNIDTTPTKDMFNTISGSSVMDISKSPGTPVSYLRSLDGLSGDGGTSEPGDDDAFGKKRLCVAASDALSEEKALYSELHLCLLRALHAVPALLPLPAHRQVLCCKQVITIVEGLTKLLEPSNPPSSNAAGGGALWRRGGVDPGLSATVEIGLENKMEAVNRLAQILLVATKTNSLFGSHVDLWNVLRRLPIYNRLVKILLTSHQGS